VWACSGHSKNVDWVLADLKVLQFNNKADGQETINISCPYQDLYITIDVINLV